MTGKGEKRVVLSVFKHNGNPPLEMHVEILQIIAMAIAISSFSLNLMMSTWKAGYIVIFAAVLVGGGALTLWSSYIAFRAIKGEAKINPITGAAMFLSLVMGLGFAAAIGTLLGLL